MTPAAENRTPPEIVVLQCSVRRIIALRRKTHPQFPNGKIEGDGSSTTKHFAAHLKATGNRKVGELVACVSFFRQSHNKQPAFIARGISTDEDYRGHGYAEELLRRAMPIVAKDTSINHFWCNARTKAVAMYQRCGWKRTEKPPFRVPGIDDDLNEMEINV